MDPGSVATWVCVPRLSSWPVVCERWHVTFSRTNDLARVQVDSSSLLLIVPGSLDSGVFQQGTCGGVSTFAFNAWLLQLSFGLDDWQSARRSRASITATNRECRRTRVDPAVVVGSGVQAGPPPGTRRELPLGALPHLPSWHTNNPPPGTSGSQRSATSSAMDISRLPVDESPRKRVRASRKPLPPLTTINKPRSFHASVEQHLISATCGVWQFWDWCVCVRVRSIRQFWSLRMRLGN